MKQITSPSIGQLDTRYVKIGSTFYLTNGTASSPALTFTSDTNSGLYRLAEDKIGLVTGGSATKGITIDSAGNVGIGTTGPVSKLHISDGNVIIQNTGGSASLSIQGGSGDSSNSNITHYGSGTGTYTGRIGFNLNYASGLWKEVMSIMNAGNVGINTTSPGARLDILPSSSTETVFRTKSLQSTAPLGSELVGNGNFTTNPDTSWTWGAGWTQDTTNLEADHATGNTAALTQSINVTNGQTYQVEITLRNRTTGSVSLSINGIYIYNYGPSTALTSNATYQRSLVANTTGTATLSITPTTDFNGSVDDITVKPITGVSQPNFSLLDDAGAVMAELRGKNSLYNLALGTNALRTNTTGSNNSALGMYALFANTTGYNNSALGVSAFRANTTGYNNSAVGTYALYSNTIGVNNSALGYRALFSNTIGVNNSALGVSALSSNTTGYYNSALGMSALQANTTGYNNSAVGVSALSSNTIGVNNSALGVDALRTNTTGVYNSALGMSALSSNTTGYNNNALGANAGRYISDGGANQTSNNSLYLGYDTRALANGDTNEIVIGFSTTGFGSNTAAYGNASMTKHVFQTGNVGIGTTEPNEKLTVKGNINIQEHNLIISTNDSWGGWARTLLRSQTGGGNKLIDIGAYGSTGTSLNYLYIGNEYNDNAFRIYPDKKIWMSGNVGINTVSPAAKLDVNGTAWLRGSGTAGLFVNSTGNVGISTTAPDYKLDVNGAIGFTPGSSVAPVDNGDVVIEATDDTTLTFKLKGSDGTVRSATLALT